MHHKMLLWDQKGKVCANRQTIQNRIKPRQPISSDDLIWMCRPYCIYASRIDTGVDGVLFLVKTIQIMNESVNEVVKTTHN